MLSGARAHTHLHQVSEREPAGVHKGESLSSDQATCARQTHARRQLSKARRVQPAGSGKQLVAHRRLTYAGCHCQRPQRLPCAMLPAWRRISSAGLAALRFAWWRRLGLLHHHLNTAPPCLLLLGVMLLPLLPSRLGEHDGGARQRVKHDQPCPCHGRKHH